MRLLIDYLLHTYVGTYEACKVLRYFYRKRFKFYPNSFFEYASKVIKTPKCKLCNDYAALLPTPPKHFYAPKFIV